MPPITVAFVVTGLAVWLNGLAFLGIGSEPAEGKPSPLVTVGWVTLTAGLVDLANAVWIIQKLFGGDSGDTGVRLAGLIAFYGLFFVALGAALIKDLDLRPIGNLAIGVALVPLAWWSFFDGGWMFKSILAFWVVSFGSVAAVIYGRLAGRALGVVLVATSLYTFLLPAAILGSGHAIP
ncbi:MAG TPA: hypothetical protein VHZ06_05855 [Marmoricola sp.]|jgi:hypothetical protein|nr:hypothetical protein [Marmoricola sp.]